MRIWQKRRDCHRYDTCLGKTEFQEKVWARLCGLGSHGFLLPFPTVHPHTTGTLYSSSAVLGGFPTFHNGRCFSWRAFVILSARSIPLAPPPVSLLFSPTSIVWQVLLILPLQLQCHLLRKPSLDHPDNIIIIWLLFPITASDHFPS